MIAWVACIVGAYMLGSIPFGLIIARLQGIDIRQHGSRNIGATNVGRTLGRKYGLLCFALDGLKGAIPVLIAGWTHGLLKHEAAELDALDMWLWLAVAIAAVMGHMYSFLLGFSGGKGVATGFGALVVMWPLLTLPALGALAVWCGVLRLTHYMSLASMLGAVSLPIWYLLSITPLDFGLNTLDSTFIVWRHGSPPLIVTTLIAMSVISKHRGNIARLLRGQELKVGVSIANTTPVVAPPKPRTTPMKSSTG